MSLLERLTALAKFVGAALAQRPVTGELHADMSAIEAAAGWKGRWRSIWVGQAKSPTSTLASLKSLKRGGPVGPHGKRSCAA
jgi:hypothetical protein